MRRVINPDDLFDPTERRYSHALVAGGTLYMSGQVGRDPAGDVAGPDIESQARQAFDNVAAILESVGVGFTSVAKVTSYLTDIEADFPAYKSVWADVFPEKPYPAHTAIGVESLATKDLRLEVEAEVVLDG